MNEKLQQIQSLVSELEVLLDLPNPNCACHISPPCSDCVDYQAIRETLLALKSACISPTLSDNKTNKTHTS